MSILKKLFGKKEEKVVEGKKIVEIYSPLQGKIIDISEIPDEAFAQKMVGDGVGIEPSGDMIYSPVNAEDIGIFETNHAVSFETKEGLEMIVHFGIDTVQLDGRGFERIATDGDSAKVGDELVKYDLEYIKKNAKSHLTPVIISSMDEVESIEKMSGEVKPGDLLMKVVLKNS
jgi:glucose-specific phosphotransferase system IIA component